jgi:DNA-binding MarR family transcriptional regulator
MKTRMAATSLEAYGHFVLGPELPRQQKAIVEFLASHSGDFTRAELAERTGLRLSSVCGRVSELIERGTLVERSRRPCSITGVAAHVVRLAPAQGALFEEAA